jgi:hypothetical protein
MFDSKDKRITGRGGFYEWFFGTGLVSEHTRVLDLVVFGLTLFSLACILIVFLYARNRIDEAEEKCQEKNDKLQEQFNQMLQTLNMSLDLFQLRAEKGLPDGYAGLDGEGRVPIPQLPIHSITDAVIKSPSEASIVSYGIGINPTLKVLKQGVGVTFDETATRVTINAGGGGGGSSGQWFPSFTPISGFVQAAVPATAFWTLTGTRVEVEINAQMQFDDFDHQYIIEGVSLPFPSPDTASVTGHENGYESDTNMLSGVVSGSGPNIVIFGASDVVGFHQVHISVQYNLDCCVPPPI